MFTTFMLATMLACGDGRTVQTDTAQIAPRQIGQSKSVLAGDKCILVVIYGRDQHSAWLKRQFARGGELEAIGKQMILKQYDGPPTAEWSEWASRHTLPAMEMQCNGELALVRCGPELTDPRKIAEELGSALATCLHGRSSPPAPPNPPTNPPPPESPPMAPPVSPSPPPVVEGAKMSVSPLGVGVTFSVGIAAMLLGFMVRAIQQFRKVIK